MNTSLAAITVLLLSFAFASEPAAAENASALPNIQSYDYDPEREILKLVFVDGLEARLHGVPKPIYEAFNIARDKHTFLLALAELLPGNKLLVLSEPNPQPKAAHAGTSKQCSRSVYFPRQRP